MYECMAENSATTNWPGEDLRDDRLAGGDLRHDRFAWRRSPPRQIGLTEISTTTGWLGGDLHYDRLAWWRSPPRQLT